MQKIKVTNCEMTEEEQMQYVYFLQAKYNREVDTLDITLDGDEVELHCTFKPLKFERIRRITGYLVGTMDNWNDAKSAEEHDRVKHSIESEMKQI